MAQINSTLAGLTYRNALHDNRPDRLTIVVDDLGNSGTGGPQQDVKQVPISIVAVNDAPVITVPGTLDATVSLDAGPACRLIAPKPQTGELQP